MSALLLKRAGFPEPLIETPPDTIELTKNRIAAPSKVELTPAIEDAKP